MTGYEPLDLSTEVNAGADGFSSSLRPAVGAVDAARLPFRIGSGEPRIPGPYVRFGAGGRGDPLRLEFPWPARTVIVAHLLLDSDIPTGGRLGSAVADYELGLDGGTPIVVPIRETFEIAALPQLDGPIAESLAWRVSTASFLALPDRHDSLAARGAGPWELAGRRLMESEQAAPDGYRLWSWRSADGRLATSLTIRPTGVAFIVAGVTVGDIDEDPFVRASREPVTITLLGPAAEGESQPLQTVVDRGVATFTRRTQPGSPDTFLADPIAGWGQAAVPADRVGQPGSPAYAHIAAHPSATIEVRRGDTTIGAVRWGDVMDRGSAVDPGRVRVEWVGSDPAVGPHDRGRRSHRPPGAVSDPLPVGVGDPMAAAWASRPRQRRPAVVAHGRRRRHPPRGGAVRASSMADARAGCPRAMSWSTWSAASNTSRCGPPVRIQPGQRELTLTLDRWTDERAAGWASGDTPRPLPVGRRRPSRGGRRGPPRRQPAPGAVGSPVHEHRGLHGTAVGTVRRRDRGPRRAGEPPARAGSPRPARPARAGHAVEQRRTRRGRDRRGARGHPVRLGGRGTRPRCARHPPHFGFPTARRPRSSRPIRIDAVEMIWFGAYFHREYYRYLDAGYRLPLVGGTDKMTNEVPVGIYRTYVQLPADEPFSSRRLDPGCPGRPDVPVGRAYPALRGRRRRDRRHDLDGARRRDRGGRRLGRVGAAVRVAPGRRRRAGRGRDDGAGGRTPARAARADPGAVRHLDRPARRWPGLLRRPPDVVARSSAGCSPTPRRSTCGAAPTPTGRPTTRRSNTCSRGWMPLERTSRRWPRRRARAVADIRMASPTTLPISSGRSTRLGRGCWSGAGSADAAPSVARRGRAGWYFRFPP